MLRLVIVLISSHGHFQYNLPALEQIQLVVSTRIASVARQDAVPIKFLDIFQIMNIMYRSFREVETADHSIQRADDMQLIAIIVSLLRSTESLVGCSIIFLPADRRARTTADPAYLQRHTVYNQIVWSRGDVFAHTFAKGGQMGGQGAATEVADATFNSGSQTIGQPAEQLAFRVYAHIFCSQREGENLHIAHTGLTMLITKIRSCLYIL